MNRRAVQFVVLITTACAARAVASSVTRQLQPATQIRASDNSIVAGRDIQNSRITVINGLTEAECEKLIQLGRRRSELDIVTLTSINKRMSELAEQLQLTPEALKEIVRIAGNQDDAAELPRKAILD